MSDGNNLLFVTSLECPFAQRTWIALEEKNAEYETRHVQLRTSPLGEYAPGEKPAWFLEMNPLGKVPVLGTPEGRDLYESTVCNEYIEDRWPEPPLLPEDEAERGWVRLAVSRFAEHFVPNFYGLLLRSDPEDRNDAIDMLDRELEWLVDASEENGPWFLGDDFTLADCAVVPFLLRLPVLNHYREYTAPRSAIDTWREAGRTRETVQSTMRTPDPYEGDWDDYMLDVYRSYAEGTPDSTSAKDYG
jgi:glutathione S-transferase